MSSPAKLVNGSCASKRLTERSGGAVKHPIGAKAASASIPARQRRMDVILVRGRRMVSCQYAKERRNIAAFPRIVKPGLAVGQGY